MSFEKELRDETPSYVDVKTIMLYIIFIDGYAAGIQSCLNKQQGKGHHSEQFEEASNIVTNFLKEARLKRDDNE